MKRTGLLTFWQICLVVSLVCLAPSIQASSPQTAEPPDSVGVTHVADGFLTVDVQNASLKELLGEIARQSGLILKGRMSPADRVTVKFHQLPFEQGLHLILRGQSYGLFSHTGLQGEQRAVGFPTELRIFRKYGQSSVGAIPVEKDEKDTPEAGSDVATLLAVLEDSEDSWEKEDAIEALAESGRSSVALPLSRLALTDDDQSVRLAAVSALATIGGNEAVEALILALDDDDGGVRKQAVEALGRIGGEQAIAALRYEWARDWSQSVRDTAAVMLERLGVRVR